MNKRTKRNLAAFQRMQRRSGRYHVSASTPHEQALREHVKRGYAGPRCIVAANEASLLNPANRI